MAIRFAKKIQNFEQQGHVFLLIYWFCEENKNLHWCNFSLFGVVCDPKEPLAAPFLPVRLGCRGIFIQRALIAIDGAATFG